MLRATLLAVSILIVACRSTSPAPTAGSASALRIQVVRLEHARAAEVEPLLQDILCDRVCQRAPGTAPAASTAQPLEPAPQLKIALHEATNSIVVSGTAAQIQEALEVIAKLDEPSKRN